MLEPAPSPAVPHGAVRLVDWGVIRAVGADARAFLHGQLTQDIEGLAPGQARLAGLCSAKGRLLATFVAWSPQADEVLLACSADLLAPTLKRLSMYVLRARCKLVDASADAPLWGVVEPAEDAAQGAALAPWQTIADGGALRIGLPGAALGGVTVSRSLRVGAAPAGPEIDVAVWDALECLSGVARVVASTAEQFVPQMVNFEVVGGVSFRKGCYPGQEVVARSQYRGTVKRRAQLLLGDGAALAPGQEIYHVAEPGQPAGMVVLAAEAPGIGGVALAEVKLAAVAAGAHGFRARGIDGPALRLGALPYTIADLDDAA